MKSFVFFLAIAVSLTAASSAQQPAAPRRPEQRIVSPEVEQGKVTFRLAAPKAQQVNVKINGLKDPVSMQRDEHGVWTATVEDLAPEIYDYQFEVDGFPTIDPANAWVKSGLRPNWSMVEVPGHAAEFWVALDNPHGNVTIHTFWSKILEETRSFRVYTPPGYEQQPEARFPVLYLLHGSGDTDDGWTIVGRANLIADNLLAAGQAKPMLIVMPNGTYPRTPGHENDFETELLQEIIPTVEKDYRVASGAGNRALAGLSMGGFQTLNIGLKHLDQFAWLGVFSAGVRDNAAETYGPFLDKANHQLSLFWMGIGEDDALLPSEKLLEALLNDHQVKFTSHISKGGHVWSNWRHYLHELMPLLFQSQAK